MGIFAVVVPMFVDPRMGFRVPVPLFPGSPMALVCIPVSSMAVMLIATVTLVGVFLVSMMLVVVSAPFLITVTVGIVMLHIILVTTLKRMFVFFLMAVVVLGFFSSPLSRFVFPFIGKGHAGAAKYYNDNNAKDVRYFHWLPPFAPKIKDIICLEFSDIA